MSHMNLVIMSGRLGADPVKSVVGADKIKTVFRLACTRKWGSGDDQEETTWVEVVCWGGLAEVVNEYCKKGREVLVKGRLSIEKWESK